MRVPHERGSYLRVEDPAAARDRHAPHRLPLAAAHGAARSLARGRSAQHDHVFSFAGTPSEGRRELEHLVNLPATVAVTRQMTRGTYYGHVFGNDVGGGNFAAPDSDYGFAELTLRY